MKTLLVTNGDSAAGLLKDAGVDATILPWRDCLHVGPVPSTKNEAELRGIRASFLTDLSAEKPDQIEADLADRDAQIIAHETFDRIELWFEHDLYDQLQLVQIVDMLAQNNRHEDIILVQAPTYLGMQSPDNILRFNDLAMPLNDISIASARKVWAAFRQPDPTAFAALVDDKIAGFPFLPQAIKRMLEEMPGRDGLSRTQRQIVYSINRGVNRPGPLFARVLAMEEAAFWGDTGFFRELSLLSQCANPLIKGLSEPFKPDLMFDDERRKAFIQSSLTLTEIGHEILDAKHDFADLNKVDFWWGGTRITNDNLWRWDPESRKLTAPTKPSRTLQ